ncbi:hypothetical protein ACFLQV_02220 [Calditrichota bacterium]
MTKSSVLKLSAVLTTLLILLPLFVDLGAQPVKTEAEEDSLFVDRTLQYIYHRNLQFSAEAYLYESYLVWLYDGINEELKKRRKEDWRSALDAFEPLNEEIMNDSLFWKEVDFDSVSHHNAYLDWEQRQRDKFRSKNAAVRHVKDNLIRSATAAQKKRMFNHDLKTAFDSYNRENYNLAVLRYNEVIERYGYEKIYDVLFYRGEAFFAQSMFDRAKIDYAAALEGLEEKSLRLNAHQRLLSIGGEQRNLSAMNFHWDEYVIENPEPREEKQQRAHYWKTLDLFAHFKMSMEVWEEAKDAFEMFTDEKSDYYANGKMHGADCALSMMDLDEAEHRYMELRNGSIKTRDMSRLIEREALLKLGYIDYLRGDYFAAYAKLMQIEGGDEVAEKAAVLSGWAVFKVHDYNKVVDICTKFLDDYPNTEYFYEVFCLMGYSEEVLGKQDSALTDYRVVMGAVDDKRAYQTMNIEKMNLTRSLGELQMLEPSMFGGSRDTDFSKYQNLQKELRKLMAQVKLAQGVRASDQIIDLIAELKSLYAAYEDLNTLQKELAETEDARLIRAYNLLAGKITRLAQDLNAGINYELHKKTLVQREEEHRFGSRTADSLMLQFSEEWASNEGSLDRVRGLMLEAEQIGDAEILAELSEVELSLISQQQQLLRVKPFLNTIGGTEVSSNLDWWSWFAFQRHSTSGLAFDHLYVRQKRQAELDQYIERINLILAERRAGIIEEVPLDSNLVLASSSGEAPYFAPKVPMWKPEIPDLPLDTAVMDTGMGFGEGDVDTSAIEGMMDEEGAMEGMDAVDPEMMQDEMPTDEMEMQPEDDDSGSEMMEDEGMLEDDSVMPMDEDAAMDEDQQMMDDQGEALDSDEMMEEDMGDMGASDEASEESDMSDEAVVEEPAPDESIPEEEIDVAPAGDGQEVDNVIQPEEGEQDTEGGAEMEASPEEIPSEDGEVSQDEEAPVGENEADESQSNEEDGNQQGE